MKIGDFNQFYNILTILRNKEKKLQKSAEKISTGKKINNVADDTSGFHSGSQIGAKNKVLQSAIFNIQSAKDLSSTAENALSGSLGLLQRLESQVVNANNATLTTSEKSTIMRKDMLQMIQEIELRGRKTSFNKLRLLDGSFDSDFQVGFDASNTKNIKIDKSTSTSIGASGDGVKAFNLLKFDGVTLGRAWNVNDPLVVPPKVIADQTITISDGYETKTVKIDDSTKSASEILKAIKNLNMDGVREAEVVTRAHLPSIDSDIHGTEGDLVKLDLQAGNQKTTASFLIGRKDYDNDYTDTNQNYHEAISAAVSEINRLNADSDLSFDGYTITSKTGKNIALGNLSVQDNAALKIGKFSNTSDLPGSLISFFVDGKEISFLKGKNDTEDMINLYSSLNSALHGQIQPDDQPPVDGLYKIRMSYDNTVVITRNNGAAGIDVTGLENNSTVAEMSNFNLVEGETVSFKVNNVDVSFLSAGLDQAANANALFSALNSGPVNSSLQALGISASLSNDKVVLKKLAWPDVNNEIVISDYSSGVSDNLIIDNFNNFAGETNTFKLDGTSVQFKSGSTQAESALNLKAALDSLNNPLYSVSLVNSNGSPNPGGSAVKIHKNNGNAIYLTDYHDEPNKATIGNFYNQAGETVAFKLNGFDVSFTAGATQKENAQALYNALLANQPLLDSGFTVQMDASGDSLSLIKNNEDPISITGYSGSGAGSSSFDVFPPSGSSADTQTVSESGSAEATVTDLNSGFRVRAGFNSTGSENILEPNVTDFDTDVYTNISVTAGAGSSGSSPLSRAYPEVTITESKAEVNVWPWDSNNGGMVLTEAPGVNSFHAVPNNYNGTRAIKLQGVSGGNINIDNSSPDNWGLVVGTMQIKLDANLEFKASSDTDGRGMNGGLFNALENENTMLEYSIENARSSVVIDNFMNNGTDPISFSINGRNITFTGAGSDQKQNANNLYTALFNDPGIQSSGISFKINGKQNGVIINAASGPINLDNYSSATESGFDATSVDATDLPRKGRINSRSEDDSYIMARFNSTGFTSARFDPFIPISQAELTTEAGLTSAGKVFGNAEKIILSNLSSLGNYQQALDIEEDFATVSLLNGKSTVSRIEDTDVALETLEQTKNDLMLKNGFAMLSQIFQVTSDMILRLFK